MLRSVVVAVAERSLAKGDDRTPVGSRSTEPTLGELVAQFSEQSSQLIRSELQLALAEMRDKTRHAGVGVGLFGAAGIVALFGVGGLVATAILALALALPAWLAALVVTVVLFLVAGVVALVGKQQASQATPPRPEQAMESVKRDIETVKESRQHDHIT